jgi:alginate O-acetyltransferase complex protein AlgI
MLFNSFVFIFVFLPITYGVFWALRSARCRYVWLTVTGPIVGFRQIEADLDAIGTTPGERGFVRGISFFVVGLVEKVSIADTLASIVDPALAHYQTLSTLGAWTAMLRYTFQLYFDFSGYSTMAAGLGYLFGLRIPQNFNSPYKALDPSDFWRRWHTSLSTCMRDYLYIPFGGIGVPLPRATAI